MGPKMILRLGFVDLVYSITSSIGVQPAPLLEISELFRRALPVSSYIPLSQGKLQMVCCRERLYVLVSDKMQAFLLSELQIAPTYRIVKEFPSILV